MANDGQCVSFPDFPGNPESVYFVACPKWGLEMEAVVLHRVGFLEKCCPKQGQDFKPLVAPLYPNMGQALPPPGGGCCASLSQKVVLVKKANKVNEQRYNRKLTR